MKKILYITIVIGLFIGFNSCKKDDKPTSGKVSLTIKKFASTATEYSNKIIPSSASLSGTSVEVHSKATFDAKVTSATYNGSSISFGSLALGKYYIMAWKDNDNNNSFSDGDYFGFVDKAVTISGGENLNLSIEMYILRN